MTCPFCGTKVDLIGLPFATTTGSWNAKLRCMPSQLLYAGGVRAANREHAVEVEVQYG